MNNDWRVIQYAQSNGRLPVSEFIHAQDDATKDRIEEAVERLRVLNVKAAYPLVRPIEGRLWELRIGSQTNIYRVFYFFWTGRQIVLLHAFQKKTQKTPNREIQVALKRMSEYL